jgi:hypothetical protein
MKQWTVEIGSGEKAVDNKQRAVGKNIGQRAVDS